MFLCRLSGVPGAGKTFLAAKIGCHLAVTVIDLDTIKSSLLTSFDDDIDPKLAGRAAYDLVFALAGYYLRSGSIVIIDSPCAYEIIIERGMKIARDNRAKYRFVECRVDDAAIISDRRLGRSSMKSQVLRRPISQQELESFMGALKRPEGIDIFRVDTGGEYDTAAIIEYLVAGQMVWFMRVRFERARVSRLFLQINIA